MTTGREQRALAFALAIMVTLVLVITGSMWLGANLSQGACARRTARQAQTIVELQRERDSLATTLRLFVCIKPGSPPALTQC